MLQSVEAQDIFDVQRDKINELQGQLIAQTAWANKLVRELNAARAKIEKLQAKLHEPQPEHAD